ncbi:imm11 family protein [Corallococcus terminator]
MAKRFFKLSDDVEVPGRWHLGIPMDVHGREVEDPWVFKKGVVVPHLGRLVIPRDHPGRSLDFSEAGFATPVLHARAAEVFDVLAPSDVQLIPVEIQGHSGAFSILVATRLIHCVDERASDEVAHWTPEDGQPEKVGQYRKVSGLRIDPARVGDAKVFRPWGWSVALIVSEDLKQALERLGATGTHFIDV